IGACSVLSQVRSPISRCASGPSSRVTARGVRSVTTSAPIRSTAPGAISMRATAKLVLAVGSSWKPGCSAAKRRSRQRSRCWIARSSQRTWGRGPEGVDLAPASDVRPALTFSQPEGHEAVRRIVGREADLHAVAGDHADAETAHAAGELRGHGLTRIEGDLVAPAAEDLLHGARCLDEIVTSHEATRP